jgi:hypothetical protein
MIQCYLLSNSRLGWRWPKDEATFGGYPLLDGGLTKPDLRRLLGFETGHLIDEFLKSHEVFEEYSLEDLECERESLRRLGF